MNWSNVKLILGREIRDQLRDRRTLFMIAVLPILLYPLLGMSLFQMQQFRQQQPTKVLVVGAGRLPEKPPLIVNKQFAPNLFGQPEDVARLELTFAPEELRGRTGRSTTRWPTRGRRSSPASTTPRSVFRPISANNSSVSSRRANRGRAADRRVDAEAMPQVPKPEILYTTANEKSQIAFARLHDVLRRWTEEVGKLNLDARRACPRSAARPFELHSANLAEQTGTAGIALWSKILPVMLLLWALTGAFYPAVDLCAGEKERGTLETLLSSPAERSEIVLGKLVTIMLFSMATAVLNLVSMGLTGWLVLEPLAGRRAAAAVVDILALPGAGARLGAVQRVVPRPGGLRPKHQGRPVLPDAAVAGHHAAGRVADDAGRRIDPGQQPHPGDRRRAACCGRRWKATTVEALRFVVPVVGVTLLVLPAGDPLGRGSVQPGIGAVSRERAAGHGPVAATPAARPAGDAQRGRGGLLRRADPDGQVLPRAGHAHARGIRRPGHHDPGDAVGRDRHADAVDDDHAHETSGADAASGPFLVASGRGRAHGDPAGGGDPSLGRHRAVDRRPALSDRRGDRRPGGTLPVRARLLGNGAAGGRGAGDLRGTGLPRVHFVGLAAHGSQVAGDRAGRLVLRHDARAGAAVDHRVPGRRGDRLPGRPDRKPPAVHRVPHGPQHAGAGLQPDHAEFVKRMAVCWPG